MLYVNLCTHTHTHTRFFFHPSFIPLHTSDARRPSWERQIRLVRGTEGQEATKGHAAAFSQIFLLIFRHSQSRNSCVLLLKCFTFYSATELENKRVGKRETVKPIKPRRLKSKATFLFLLWFSRRVKVQPQL